MFLGLAYQQVAIIGMRHNIVKRDSTIKELQAKVDRQEETIVGLKRGLHNQVRIAAVIEKVERKK